MNCLQAFAYQFKSSRWWKFLLLAIFANLTLFGQPLVVGYGLRTSRRYVRGEDLPELNSWGSMYWDGLRVIALFLAYFFTGPLIVFVPAMIAFFSELCGYDGMIVTVLRDTLPFWAIVGSLLFVAGAGMGTVAYLFLIREGSSLKDCFRRHDVFGLLCANKWNVAKFILAAFVVYLLFSFIGLGIGWAMQDCMEETIANYIGISLVYPLAMLVVSALYGQLALIALPKSVD